MCDGGGGGLTPSDIAPARLSQQQIDELQRQYRIADVLPLTPLQQGLLFHASTAQGNGDDVYAMQLDITVTGPLDPHRLRDAVHTVVNRHPNLAARFCDQFDEPVQIIPADPVAPWRYVELDAGDDVDLDEQIQRVCAAERAAVCDLADPPAFRVGFDPHRTQIGTGLCSPITTSCWMAGRCRSCCGKYSPAITGSGCPRPGRIAGLSPGWPVETSMPPTRPGARCWPALTPPHWSARRTG